MRTTLPWPRPQTRQLPMQWFRGWFPKYCGNTEWQMNRIPRMCIPTSVGRQIPDLWEAARKELADIISGGSTGCPDCSAANVIIENQVIQSANCECIASSSITIGPNVIVKSDSKLTLKSPRIVVKAAFQIERGAVLISGK
jgi:hypothetical protein